MHLANLAKQTAYKYFVATELTLLHACSYLPNHRIRLAILRLFGASIGPGTVVYRGLQVRNARGLTIGANCSVGDGAVLDARGGLSIGDRVNISSEVMIWSRQHDWRARDFATQDRAVFIGDYAWISARAILLPGAVIGRGAVVAAGAVVSGQVTPHTVVAGVPAKAVQSRREDLDYVPSTQRGKVPWW